MTFPRISIVTPVLNQAQFLEPALRSVLDQNYPNLEYIVVDGGSTDGSVDIIRRYADRLHYWVSEPDKGMYDALNKGLAMSTGEVMLWLNSDDMLHPHALDNISRIFSSFEHVHVITGINTAFDERGRVIAAGLPRNFSKYDVLLNNFEWIQQESTAWRRTLWNKAGGKVDSSLRLAGDLDLWLRFLMLEKLYRCEVLVGGFRFRSGQLSVDQRERYMKEALEITRKMRSSLTSSEKRQLFVLQLIKAVRKILYFSFVLDLALFNRVLNRMERSIHNYPGMIRVNRQTFEFEIK